MYCVKSVTEFCVTTLIQKKVAIYLSWAGSSKIATTFLPKALKAILAVATIKGNSRVCGMSSSASVLDSNRSCIS